MDQRQTPGCRVAILQSPGMGHLIPHIEFAKRLILQRHFSVTLIVPTDGPLSKAQTTFLESLPTGMDYTLLAPVTLDGLLSHDVGIETRICLTLAHSLSSLRDVIRSLVETTNLVALVVDGLGTDALDIAKEFNISFYIFFTSPALCFSFVYYLPKLDQELEGEYKDLSEPLRLPGCIPIHGKDLFDPAQDRKNDVYKWLLHHSKRYILADGIILNTFKNLEEEALKALQEPDEARKPPIYPIGPLIQMSSSSESNKHDERTDICSKWLDEQQNSSVLFVSFGSGGTLSFDQFTELALGLEMSEQRFIWVIRIPNDKSASAAFFGTRNQEDDPLGFLPEGFVERTEGRGLLVPSWAPQARILGHASTGGFLSHCGWNSVLESLMNGIPLMAWPLYAEQKMNAVMLTEDLKVALWPKASENGVVGRVEIANVAKNLMAGEEGKEIRKRTKVLMDLAKEAISEDGISTNTIAELAQKMEGNCMDL